MQQVPFKGIKIKRFTRPQVRSDISDIEWNPSGKVSNVIGEAIEAYLPGAKLGTIVTIDVKGSKEIEAEVVGFKDDKVIMLPFSNLTGISPGNAVYGSRSLCQLPVGDFLLGKVIDPMLNDLNHGKLAIPERPHYTQLDRTAPNPMQRSRIHNKLNLGVRAIDGLLTFGEGQRIGIMAGSGVGKSVLLGMMARGGSADVNVIGLIGERGREVREFLERDLGPEGLKKSVVVVVTSDQSPLMRIRGAKMVTAIAEHFSDRGKKVLLMMDSLTRVAMAQREIGLAIGEPPTTKGYPPSVFSLLPKLLERCGPQRDGAGSISGLYTVLVDGDDFNDPIPDAVRSILDGHINLSRSLAARNHFPAIEITTSVSRVMNDIVDENHKELASHIRSMLGAYEEKADLIQIGGYQPGVDPMLDQAITLKGNIDNFLKQNQNDLSTEDSTIDGMQNIFRIQSPQQFGGE